MHNLEQVNFYDFNIIKRCALECILRREWQLYEHENGAHIHSQEEKLRRYRAPVQRHFLLWRLGEKAETEEYREE